MGGRLRRGGRCAISHETIYRHIWDDARTAAPSTPISGARGSGIANATGTTTAGAVSRATGIAERPPIVEHAHARSGIWEGDTVLGARPAHCVLSSSSARPATRDRQARRAHHAARTVARPRSFAPSRTRCTPSRATTAPSSMGTGTRAATPRGSISRRHTTRGSAAPTRTPTAWSASTCQSARAWRTSRSTTVIASPRKLNRRPRKRLGYRTPEECYER